MKKEQKMTSNCANNSNESMAARIDTLREMIQNLSEQTAMLSRRLDTFSKSASEDMMKNSETILHTMDARIQKTERLLRRRFDAMLWNILFEEKRESPHESINQSPSYDYIFYLNNRYHSMVSAQHILQPLFQELPHKSVVDFGCGTGTWLWVAQALGAEEILGYDGDYVPRDLLLIPEASFAAVNLENRITAPQKFDLAMSLEVGEHLSADSADIFVENIARSSDTVLFSAAHPGQGGTDHINEQPIEYWIEKFEKFGFTPIEIKQRFQDDDKIAKWYRQNVILFVKH